MSTRVRNFRRYFIGSFFMASMWAAACTVAFQNSSFAGGETEGLVQDIMSEIQPLASFTPSCAALATDLLSAGIKAKRAIWLPTSDRIQQTETEAAKHYELGQCPMNALPMIAFAMAAEGNQAERERQVKRGARW